MNKLLRFVRFHAFDENTSHNGCGLHSSEIMRHHEKCVEAAGRKQEHLAIVTADHGIIETEQ